MWIMHTRRCLLSLFVVLTACSDGPTEIADLSRCQDRVDVEGPLGSDFAGSAFFVNEGGSLVPIISVVSTNPREPQAVAFDLTGFAGQNVPAFTEGTYTVSGDLQYPRGYVNAAYGNRDDDLFGGTSGTLTLERVTSDEIRGRFDFRVADRGGRTGRLSGAFRAAAGLCVPGGA